MRYYTWTYMGNDNPHFRPSEPKSLLQVALQSQTVGICLLPEEFEEITDMAVGESFVVLEDPTRPQLGVKGEFTRVE